MFVGDLGVPLVGGRYSCISRLFYFRDIWDLFAAVLKSVGNLFQSPAWVELAVGGSGIVVRVSDLGLKDSGFDPRAVPKSECMFINIYHYCVLCYIMCLIVVVCTIVNLWHWVSLVPLFGSMYIAVLNCVCYVMFIWWSVLYYMHCPAWLILCNPAFMLQYK